jgi:hypothetical protein
MGLSITQGITAVADITAKSHKQLIKFGLGWSETICGRNGFTFLVDSPVI